MSAKPPALNIAARLCPTADSYKTPSPWLMRKHMPIVVMALSTWSFYVAVGRVCYPAIREHDGAGYSRTAGIALLVVFVILWLMFMWCYVVILITPPGYATDAQYVPKSENPYLAVVAQYAAANASGPPPPAVHNPEPSFPDALEDDDATHSPDDTMSLAPTDIPSRQQAESSAGTLAIDPSAMSPKFFTSPKTSSVPRPVPPVMTGPRYCTYCEIIKPARTHHCRHCGTCILQFDHHCPWIGQCVGWGNHAVFMVFNFWAGLFLLFNSLILVIDMAISSTIDPQKIVLIVICGFLAIFTLGAMLPTHLVFILTGKTTLESFQTNAQERAEQAALKLEFPNACPVRDIRRVRKEWDEEYGGTQVNDRWAFGRKWDMWRREMGPKPLGWILPVGRPQGDGINFASNPRFGPNGEWLRMEDWPKVVAIAK